MSRPSYPRNRLIRGLLRKTGRFVANLLTDVEIEGMENYPETGRLIVVANHTGVMETVLMTSFAPRQIEYMGSVDIPHEPQLAVFMNAYKFIPVFRGNVSLSAMKAGIHVLMQEGVIGIFPEGGIWEPAIRQAQSGAAWMSYHGQAPILPIGFTPTAGALGQALALKRPKLVMKIGKLIPPVTLAPGIPKKMQFEDASQQIMDSVWELIPDEARITIEELAYERFELTISASDKNHISVPVPDTLEPRNGASFSKFLYRTTLINNFRINLKMDIEPLKKLNCHPPAAAIHKVTSDILAYLDRTNPYYFTYRYGQEEGTRFSSSIREINLLAAWADKNGLSLSIQPIRKTKKSSDSVEIVETHPSELPKW